MGINLGITHLRAVVALADHASFTTAATALQISQPNLSRAIAEAERRLGTRLFERTTRSVRVTGDGREVAARARRVLLEFDDGLAEIGRFVSGERGTVAVACLPSIAATFLPPFIVRFRAAYPDVAVDIRDGLRDDVLNAVRHGAVDFAVVAAAGGATDLDRNQIGSDSFVCALPPDHALAQRETVDWSDLNGQPFIAFGPESSISTYVTSTLERIGVTPGPTIQAHNVGAVAGLVAAGLGITAVPELVVPMMSFAGLEHRRLVPSVSRDIAVVTLPGRSPSASTRAFLSLLTAVPSPTTAAAGTM